MRRLYSGILASLIVLALLTILSQLGLGSLREKLWLSPKSGIKITSTPSGMSVFINQTEVGKTPYQDDTLSPGEIKVSLVQGDASWEGVVKLTEGTVSVLNKELSADKLSFSGESLVLYPNAKGVNILSTPSGAWVEVDGIKKGSTPLFLDNLILGEHKFKFSKEGFLDKEIQATLSKGLRLEIKIELSPEGIGQVAALPTPQVLKELIINSTPTGFLRVRSEATLNSSEVAQVNPGDIVVLLEDKGDWKKIRTKSGVEGYVSSDWVSEKQ